MLHSRRVCCGCTVLLATAAFISCSKGPRIEFTKIPEAGRGGPNTGSEIEGRVVGASAGQRIVLYARSSVWYIQPLAAAPFTRLGPDSRWKSSTHIGMEYAALLVDAGFVPPSETKVLPSKGGQIAAVAQVKGWGYEGVAAAFAPKYLRFSGFDWEARSAPSDRGGELSPYDPQNAWVDPAGRLHLKITRDSKGWRCSEVRLVDSLGYGTYSFAIGETRHLEPGAVISLYTFDKTVPRENFREMNIELSQWGEPLSKNAQYAIQPYYVPANVLRFIAPAGKLNHSLRWGPRQADFTTAQPGHGRVIANYSFTSGVPAPGEESIYIALYRYGLARTPLTRETEVIVESFDYAP